MTEPVVRAREAMHAWGRILTGYRPNFSVEITKEYPLRCPGCYAYDDEYLGGEVTLRGLSDYKGDELVDRFMALIDRHRPLHVSIVGGDPGCANCGCIASAELEAIGRHRLLGDIPVGRIFYASTRIGRGVARLRGSSRSGTRPSAPPDASPSTFLGTQ